MINADNTTDMNYAIRLCMIEMPCDSGLYSFVDTIDAPAEDKDGVFMCTMDNGKTARVYVGFGTDYDGEYRAYVSIAYDGRNFICASAAVPEME